MRKFIKSHFNSILFFFLSFAGLLSGHLAVDGLILKDDFNTAAGLIGLTAVMLACAFFTVDKTASRTKNIEDDVTELRKRIYGERMAKADQESGEAEPKETEPKGQEKDILELMLENMGEIRKYYEISKNHVQHSFRLSLAMSIVGVMILTASIVLAFVNKEYDSAIIAVISGAVTELFAGTALLVHKSATAQLNRYYKALHENERFLSTVNLVSKISQGKQNDVYINIIETSLELLKEMTLRPTDADGKDKE